MSKEEISKRIIEAAVAEFLARGLDGSIMENIAREANVSKRTLYKYFPNKEAIFDSLTLDLLEATCAVPPVSYSKTESFKSQLEKMLDRKAEMLTDEKYVQISKLVFSEFMKGRQLSEGHQAKFYESERKFLKWIDAAKKAGAITSKQSSELISNQIHSNLKGQLFYPVIFGLKKLKSSDIKQAKAVTMEFVLKSFCG
ncbi:Bacterial regulatory protein, tetR family [compost metagenome]